MEWTKVTSVIVAAAAFIATQLWLIYQIKSKDDRANKKLHIFKVLNDDSLTLEEIHKKYNSKYGTISLRELEKSIYEMLVDETAFYEHTGTYRAHWRNPKDKRKNRAT